VTDEGQIVFELVYLGFLSLHEILTFLERCY